LPAPPGHIKIVFHGVIPDPETYTSEARTSVVPTNVVPCKLAIL
jgi:hypothetical protein